MIENDIDKAMHPSEVFIDLNFEFLSLEDLKSSIIEFLKKQGFRNFEKPMTRRVRITVGERGFWAIDYRRFLLHAKELNSQAVDTYKNTINHSDGYFESGVELVSLNKEIKNYIPSGGPWLKTSEEINRYAELKRKPCLFLDRDGVVVKNVHYMFKNSDVEIIPEVAELISHAKQKSWYVVVVSNQSGVGRGYFTDSDCQKINKYINERLIDSVGVGVDEWLYCPYHPTDAVGAYKRDSVYRKPKAGMIHEACALHPIDIDRSIMVGDNVTDVLEMPGLSCVLVQSDRDISGAPKNIKKYLNYQSLFFELRTILQV